MAWTTMHFAAGMGCAGAIFGTGCFVLKRGWRWLPAAMTVGGVWALLPDLPRVFREDFPNAPFAALLGNHDFERWLHSFGNLFAFHRQLDRQPHEYALLGLLLILIFYNLSIAMLMWMEHRQRHSPGNRAWRAHEPQLRKCRPPHDQEEHLPRLVGADDDEQEEQQEEDTAIAGRIHSSHLKRSS